MNFSEFKKLIAENKYVVENQRSRHLHENMNEYQVENHRARNLRENMNEYQVDNQRSRHLQENRNTRFLPIAQE